MFLPAFTPWETDELILQNVSKLSHVDIGNPDSVHERITILESLGSVAENGLIEYGSPIDENEARFVMDIFWNAFNMLKREEGLHFKIALIQYKCCLRLLHLVFGLLYDNFGFEMPEKMRYMV
ncbi:hypothetical protein SAMN02745216_02987 [Desulfatibacillum alkenivorans DSM 16219]|jgi:hypothetical protein|uniref:Uncharacterized protein n=1 Tax=Desulfatibacillum alkenivorans DSM 16219 TaxID=1121393 RepID=A0A1M6Q7R2_9BACT|nr:hypothetical protein [Desulfatibacillum alkenivorans]SHK16231.1 hypothetical protein SAMN02745216_02987 [Desulfatibacillum alkenivorans DSM 16219]